MDYAEFLKQTEKLVAKMDAQRKEQSLLNLIRTTSKDNYEKVIALLTEEKSAVGNLAEQISQAEVFFQALEDGSLYFTASGYEDYENGYWESEWGYEYEDPMGIIPKVHEVLRCAEELLYQQDFVEALALYKGLVNASFQIYDVDSEEEFEYDFSELTEIDELDAVEIAARLLYLIYQTTEGAERIQQFYQYYQMQGVQNTGLADVFSKGPLALADREDFLIEWIEFLKSDGTSIGQRFMEDALHYCAKYQDPHELHQLAFTTAKTHPQNYLLYLEKLRQSGEIEELLQWGMEALNVIPVKSRVRSQVALKTAEAAQDANDSEILKDCYLAAFYSDPNVENLLRALTLELTIAEQQQLQTFVKQNIRHKSSLLLFFLRDFETVYQTEKKDRQLLGWRSSDKGSVIPLFLLTFDQQPFSKADRKVMADIAFSCEMESSAFIEAFRQWHNGVVLEEEDRIRYFNWCRQQVEKRAEKMLDTKFRDHYPRIAALLVALGEAAEALGEVDGRAQMIQKYLQLHQRKRLFKAAMQQLM